MENKDFDVRGRKRGDRNCGVCVCVCVCMLCVCLDWGWDLVSVCFGWSPSQRTHGNFERTLANENTPLKLLTLAKKPKRVAEPYCMYVYTVCDLDYILALARLLQ